MPETEMLAQQNNKQSTTENQVKDVVKDYYGKVLSSSHDLQTDACCTDAFMPEYVKTALKNIHDEVLIKYYGCGLVLPEALDGKVILDLGCGAGRDCYALAQLVGESGKVIGVDMTEEQIAVAKRHVEYHRKRFGYKQANTEFKLGYIERLNELDLADNSVDIIVSNCVINLSPDKNSVLKEAYRVLKPGGEMYFSDVYSSRRVPSHLVQDPELYGECLSGAMYWNDFHQLAKCVGFLDPRIVTDRRLEINNDNVANKIGHIDFYSATYRLFKLPDLETHCEDYGQAVIYKGGVPHHEACFVLDGHHRIDKGKVFPVCGNTWRILKDTRFSKYFEFIGNFDTHYGIFADCGDLIPFNESKTQSMTGGGCC
ncbi:methyltransferase domain-containing protein [Agaribacter flavus]|uniref:Arsenite methyltransferase n=1 Tax=Agaribacter flavus TaxID=1902781 RepID=A0ABV7FIJ4_9ALTE